MNSLHQTDTIAAIATALGDGGVAILRISGDQAENILGEAFRPAKSFKNNCMQSHRLYYGHLVDETGAHLDEVMAVLMRAPKTYTREDVAEIHCHGGRAAMQRALARVISLGARAAEPGEFTRRAFLNGRIDLMQAEAVMAMISAGSDSAYRASVRQLEGGASAFIRGCRNDILALMARIEAANDFPDEIDELSEAREAACKAKAIAARLMARSDAKAARIVREGASVVLAGKPNVGKSSLMNALLGSERAIVTDVAGTTRDVLTEQLTVNGVALTLSDTAGQRETADAIEAIGVERAERAMATADVILLVLDGAAPLTPEDEALLAARDARYIVVRNKADALLPAIGDGAVPADIEVSALTGEGVPALLEMIAERIAPQAQEEDLLTGERHIAAAQRAAHSLSLAAAAIEEGQPLDVASVDLWDAIRTLGELTGEDATEALISEVFASFCVGK